MILFDTTSSFPDLTNESTFVITATLEVSLIDPNAEEGDHFSTFWKGGGGEPFGRKEPFHR